MWVNIPKYKSFKLCYDFNTGGWGGYDICGFFKGNDLNRDPASIDPLTTVRYYFY